MLLMRCRRGCRHPPPASPRALAPQPPRQLSVGIGAAADWPSAPPWLGATAQQLAGGTRHLKGRCSQPGAGGVHQAGWQGWHQVLAAPEPSRFLTPLRTQHISACQRGAGGVPVRSRPPSLPPQEMGCALVSPGEGRWWHILSSQGNRQAGHVQAHFQRGRRGVSAVHLLA